MDLSHSAGDIFFLGMDYPEGARVNVSIDRRAARQPPLAGRGYFRSL
jgi:hypothetical protein